MQPKKTPNVQISSRKGANSRIGSQPSQPVSQLSNNNSHQARQKQDAIASIVKEYLEKSGYPRTFQTFKNEKPVRRAISSAVLGKNNGHMGGAEDEKLILSLFERGNREEFFKNTSKIFAVNSLNVNQETMQYLRKLEFELQIYFCIYNLHPCTPGTNKKGLQVERAAAEAFRKFIDSKGQEVSQQAQLLTFFALPFVPKPQQNPAMAKLFTKQWLNKIKQRLLEAIKQYNSRNTTSSNKQNKKTGFPTVMHEMYDRYYQSHIIDSRIKQQGLNQNAADLKLIQKLKSQNQKLTRDNKQVISYLDIMQQNMKELHDASKNNLVETNRKWFQFSKEIIQLTKRAMKGENVKDEIEKHERFFGTNINDLIYCTDDISIFEKNSYTEDQSIVPGNRNQGNFGQMVNNPSSQITPIDYKKIRTLFSKANNKSYQVQICLVLKALKERLCYHKNAYMRREVVVSYQRNDLCAVEETNYEIQRKLLIESPDRVKQFYLRLMNYISTDDLGNLYLSGSEKLIRNLIEIMGSTNEEVPYRKHVFGTLQRFSYIKKSQLQMISYGIIPMIFKIFRSESDTLEETTIQYLMGLIMNLAVKKESIINFEKHKSEIVPILLKYIDVEDSQIKGYVNGTLYVLLQLESVKRQALEKYKLKEIIKTLLAKTTARMEQLDAEEAEYYNTAIRQYSYILERLDETHPSSLEAEDDNYDDDDDDEQCIDDIEQMEIFSDDESNTSEYIEGEENTLSGEDLLMKRYALLGPEAVREEIINKSILDETSRKSNNMTTSISYSKRIDKVFYKVQRPETPSLLPGNLDQSITPLR